MLLDLIAKYHNPECGMLHERVKKVLAQMAGSAPDALVSDQLRWLYRLLEHTCVVQRVTSHRYCGSKGEWNLPSRSMALPLWLSLCYEECANCMQ
jgi:hypothetical protein